MARDFGDGKKEGVDFEMVPSNAKDSKGNPVMTRRFFTRAEKAARAGNAPATSQRPQPRPAAPKAAPKPAASNAPATSQRPKARPAAPAAPARVSAPAANTPMPARAAGLSTPPVPARRPAPAMGGAKAEERMATPTRRSPNSMESFQENYDIMGNAYRKGGMVGGKKLTAKAAVGGMIDPKSMTSGQKTKAKAMMTERGATPRGLTKAYYSSGRAFSKGGKVK